MNKSEVTSARVATEAGLVLTHGDDMIKRLTKSKELLDAFVAGPSTLSDDIAGTLVLLKSAMIVAGSSLNNAADKVGHAPTDAGSTTQEIRERNG